MSLSTRFALALLATLWLAAPAWGATCTFSASGDWTAIGTHPAADCSPITNADDVVIPTGITITIKGTITFDGTTDSSITVESGGALQCAIDSTDTACELAYNTAILCQAGSTCNFSGAYRQFGDETPELQTDFDTAGLGFAGQLLPCPAYDASADTFVMDCAKHETALLEITGAPLSTGNVTLTLDGVGYSIAVTSGESIDRTAGRIADDQDVRDNGYYAGQNRMDANKVFITAGSLGNKTDIGFNAGTTGVTFSLTKVHDGDASAVGGSPDRASSEWEYGLIYSHDAYDQVTGSEEGFSYIVDAIGDIAAGDVLCWWDGDLTDTQAPHDILACYEVSFACSDTTTCAGIADAGTTIPYAAIILDIRRTDVSNAHHTDYPFYLRSIKADVANAAYTVGTRTIVTTGTDVIHENLMLPGRFVRSGNCASAGACLLGELSDVPYIISEDTDDVGGDQFKLADLNGISTAIASGDDVVIDYGWREGDPFFVMKPAIIKRAATEHTDVNNSPIELDGTHSLEAVLFDSIYRIRSENAPTKFQRVWARDSLGRDVYTMEASPVQSYTHNHVLFTGGAEKCTLSLLDSGQSCDFSHGWKVSGNQTFNGFDLMARHIGDAMLVYATTNETTFNITRARCDASSRGGDSQNWFAVTGTQNPNGTMQDVVLTSCTSTDANAEIYADKDDSPTTPMVLKNFVDISNSRLNNGDSTPAAATSLSNYLRIGASGTDELMSLPQIATRFVYREGTLNGGTSAFQPQGYENVLKNSIVRNIEWKNATEGFRSVNGAKIAWENNALIDVVPDSSISGILSIIRGQGMADPSTYWTIDRTSFVWRPGVDADQDTWAYMQGAGATVVPSFTNVLVYGFAGAQGVTTGTPATQTKTNTECGTGTCWIGTGNVIATSTFEGICIDNGHEPDGNGTLETVLVAPVVRDKALQLVDIPSGRIDPIPGGAADVAGCGIKRGASAPGISRSNWALSVTGLPAEYIGPAQAGGGGGGGGNPRTY